MGAISLASRASFWYDGGSWTTLASDILASTSPKRASMSFSFWKVMESTGFAPAPGGRRPRAPASRLGGGLLLVLAELPVEALDAAGRVDELLLAGEEGVAAGADLQTQVLALRGPRGPGGAAGAMHVDDLVLGMDPRLHRELPTAIILDRNPSCCHTLGHLARNGPPSRITRSSACSRRRAR